MPCDLNLYDLSIMFSCQVIFWCDCLDDMVSICLREKCDYWCLSLFYGWMSMCECEFGIYVDVISFISIYVIYEKWHVMWKFMLWYGYSLIRVVTVELSSFLEWQVAIFFFMIVVYGKRFRLEILWRIVVNR